MLLSTILELSGAAICLFGGGVGTAFALRSKPAPKPHLTEYQPEDRPTLVATFRHEFTDEQGNGLGELVPEGQDPHRAVMEREKRDGRHYGARAVTAAP